MTSFLASTTAVPSAIDRPVHDPWNGLRVLLRTRLLVAVVALPVAALVAPGASPRTWWALWWTLLFLGGASALYALGIRMRRGFVLQTAVQLAGDVVLVLALAAYTGGPGSPFCLFLGLVVVTGGLLGRVLGGLMTALVSSLAYLALPGVATAVGVNTGVPPVEPAAPTGAFVAYLAVLGVLAGVLGDRNVRTRADLERTTRELDRVRVDNDVVLRHLTTGVMSVDATGAVSYLNPAAEQVLGLRGLECRGLDLNDAMPERLAPLRELVQETLRTRAPRARAEIHVQSSTDRRLPVGVSTNLLMHEGRSTGVVAVFQDLTEVRDMERRARRNETLAEIGALSARIAHELRNGLSPISGSVECLQRELKLEGENAVLMELIGRECGRLNRFVTDLLNYSRERDLAIETIELEDHLEELCETLARDTRCASGIAVRCERRHLPVRVHADREQIRQVWLNLASNAFDAMPGGGRLSVRWREGDVGHVVVEFEDTGSGIAAEDLPRVGQPFYTTKQEGTGLGLAIAMRIVERHGGVLSLDSASGRGTVARVALPGEVGAVARVA